MGIYKALKKRSQDPNWRPQNKERMLEKIEEGIKRNQRLLENNPKPAKVDLINEKISFLTTKKEEISNY